MNAFKYALTVFLLSSVSALAAPASEPSIKELLDITQAQKLLDGMRAQIDTLMNNAAQQALQGKAPTVKQQQAIANMQSKMSTVMRGELAWGKMEPMYMRVYKETFTEEEIGGMLVFYRTPAGQAVIHKMPVLMQTTMLEVQKMLAGTGPKMQKIQEEFMAEMKAARK